MLVQGAKNRENSQYAPLSLATRAILVPVGLGQLAQRQALFAKQERGAYPPNGKQRQTRHRRRPAWLCGGGASPTLRTLRQLAQRQALFAKQERGLRAVYNLDLPLPQGETRSGRVPCVGCVAA